MGRLIGIIVYITKYLQLFAKIVIQRNCYVYYFTEAENMFAFFTSAMP